MSERIRIDSRDALLAWRDKPVHIVGAASAEGIAVLRLLDALNFTKITIHDSRDREILRKAFRTVHGAYSRIEQDALWDSLKSYFDLGGFGDEYLQSIEEDALLVLGQGWKLDAANRAQIERLLVDHPNRNRTSMTELYFALNKGIIAGITGTNGKSTTVALVDHILNFAQVAHRTAGNERSHRQFLFELADSFAPTLALLEVSNRQLDQLGYVSPQIAAITSLTPDHLGEHGGFAEYIDIKRELFAHQKAGDIAVVNADSATCMEVVDGSATAVVRCGLEEHASPSVLWRDDSLFAINVPTIDSNDIVNATLATTSDVQLLGRHNLQNVAVAVAVAISAGVPADAIAPALRTFMGTALRMESLGVFEGVEWYSDIKSTTPEAALAALDSVAGRGTTILIAGGDDKGLDYAHLAEQIVARSVKTTLVPGSATNCLRQELQKIAGNSHDAINLDEAIRWASHTAQAGDVIIVSPAAAGFWTRELQNRPSLRTRIKDLHSKETHTV